MQLNEQVKSLLRWPEKFPCDKRLHFIIGGVLTSLMLVAGINLLLITSLILAIAWGIEWFQKETHSGTYDNWDAVAVVLGAIVSILGAAHCFL